MIDWSSSTDAIVDYLRTRTERDPKGDLQLDASEFMKELSSNGLLTFGFTSPSAKGVGLEDLRKATDVLRKLAGVSLPAASTYMINGILAPLCVSLVGSTSQRQELLSKVEKGEMQFAFAMTEPEAGSDAASMTTSVRSHEGAWLLSGQKTYITGASTADFILVVARQFDDASPDLKRFQVVLVPRGAEGLLITDLGKVAGNSHPSCHVELTDVHVPHDAVLVASDLQSSSSETWTALRAIGTVERLMVAAMATGVAEAATLRATEFAKQRQQFGKPISKFQAVQHALVEMATLTKAMSLFVDAAVSSYGNDGGESRVVPMTKYFCSEQLQSVVALAVRVMGGRAYFDFEPVSRYYRESPFYLFAGGTIEIQKMLIARSLNL